ncbi:hypothetical protein C2857_007895 [Epichloe festucae Fl1]|uniref:Uncharacterized protein n=1 Tax=Epichloe festucae (strain Fl1) TaxID=877507 RepID=A0A7S9KR57_EPIFF|nr:hypothetical protein C2857_007895 [Epichloe festucae Fl1]
MPTCDVKQRFKIESREGNNTSRGLSLSESRRHETLELFNHETLELFNLETLKTSRPSSRHETLKTLRPSLIEAQDPQDLETLVKARDPQDLETLTLETFIDSSGAAVRVKG